MLNLHVICFLPKTGYIKARKHFIVLYQLEFQIFFSSKSSLHLEQLCGWSGLS